MARNVYEKEKLAHEKAISDEIEKYEGIIARADEEGRRLTDEENEDIAHSIKKIKTLQTELGEVAESLKTLDEVRDISRKMGPGIPSLSDARVTSEAPDRLFAQMNATMFPQAQKSFGEQFVSSAGYKSLRERGFAGEWSTGQVNLDTKGTLLEGAGSPGAGSGGGLRRPSRRSSPASCRRCSSGSPSPTSSSTGQADRNSIRYVVEGTATSGAAGVAEGGNKPESTLGLTTTDEPIKKIATLLPVSEEMLEDAPQIQSYINGRLVLFVKHRGGAPAAPWHVRRQRGPGPPDLAQRPGLRGRHGRRQQGGAALQGHERHARLRVRRAGLDRDAPDRLAGHPPADGHRRAVLRRRPVPGSLRQRPRRRSVDTGAGRYRFALEHARLRHPRNGGDQGHGDRRYPRGGTGVPPGWAERGRVELALDVFRLNLVAIRAEERLGLAVYRPGAYTELRLS
jgi:hypothetical protein